MRSVVESRGGWIVVAGEVPVSEVPVGDMPTSEVVGSAGDLRCRFHERAA